MCKNSYSTIVNLMLVSLLPCIPDGYKYTFFVHVLVNVHVYVCCSMALSVYNIWVRGHWIRSELSQI